MTILDRWGKETPTFAFIIQKHQFGHHDQSTHAPHKITGVPEGIDLEGKRYSTAAIVELARVKNNYEDAKYEAEKIATQERLKHNDTAEGTKAYVQSLENNKELQASRKELEENYLFKDAMNLHDANGVRLGEKWKDNIYEPETPEDYLLRVGTHTEAVFGEGDYGDDIRFWHDDIDSTKFAGIRTNPEESIQVATKDFHEFANTAESVVVMPQSKLNTMMADGRYKTVHETGQSGATVGKTSEEYLDHRSVYESVAYGYDDSTPVEARPVSGMLIGQGGHVSDGVSIYGGSKPAEIVLKPTVRERTTWTDNDSLNRFVAGKSFASTVLPANYMSQQATVYRKGSGKNFFNTKAFGENNMLEIQVHGGVKVSDIGKVRFFNSPPSKALASRLEKAGIPYETVPLEESE